MSMSFLKRLFGGGSALPTLTAADLAARLGRADAPFVLDVRQPEEFASGRVPGARLIPLGELPQRLAELPQDREIAVVCRSGARSAAATAQLVQAGYPARNLAGGMMGWRGPVERG